MKKLLFLTGLAVFFQWQLAFAQKFTYGVHAGINMTGFREGDSYRVYDSKAKTGYEVGAGVHYGLSNHLRLTSGLSLVQSGGRFALMSNYYPGADDKNMTEFPEVNTKIISLDVPLKVGYEFCLNNHFSLIPCIGVYGRYSVASIKDDVTTTGYDTKEKWDAFDDYNRDYHHIDAFKKADFGLLAGVEALFAKHFVASLEYRHGLVEQTKQLQLKTQGLSMSVGYRW